MMRPSEKVIAARRLRAAFIAFVAALACHVFLGSVMSAAFNAVVRPYNVSGLDYPQSWDSWFDLLDILASVPSGMVAGWLVAMAVRQSTMVHVAAVGAALPYVLAGTTAGIAGDTDLGFPLYWILTAAGAFIGGATGARTAVRPIDE